MTHIHTTKQNKIKVSYVMEVVTDRPKISKNPANSEYAIAQLKICSSSYHFAREIK